MIASEPTRVFFLIPTLRGGGAEKVIVTLLQHLDRSRFRLALVVADLRDAVFQHDVPEDVELIDIGSSRVRYAIPRIVRLIWQRRPDAVVSTLGHLNLALAIVRPLLPNAVRFVARETAVVSEVIRDYRRATVWGWAYRHLYDRFDTVVCQSQDMRDDLVANFDFPQDQAVVINNPVDTQHIRQMAADPLVTGFEPSNLQGSDAFIHLLAVGRLVSQKGFDLLIEALALCGDPRLRLTILGEGPLRSELQDLALHTGVAKQVRFAGFQKNPYPFFAQAAAFVLSSRFEGCPNVVLEALACGTPVIATPAPGGVKEVLEGVHGCEIADAVSIEALASAITRWVAGGRSRLHGEAFVAPFEVERIAQRYGEVLLPPS